MTHPDPPATGRAASPLVLAGGELLLSGATVADVGRALRLAQRTAARDGIGLSPLTRRLLAAVDEALSRQAATATGTPELPAPPVVAPLTDDVIGTGEAAALMNRTDRNVRDLCARGSLVTARWARGRWSIDRAEVADLIERRLPDD